MTIALCLKVSDGAVFGADSAATVFDAAGERVYTSAEKIVNLHKQLPLGMVVYGLGGMGGRSTTTLAKDLRSFFSGPVEGREEFEIDADGYTMEEVAGHVRRYFFEELYTSEITPIFEELRETAEQPETVSFPDMGFLIAGMAAGESKSEIWSLAIDADGNCSPASRVDGGSDGVVLYRGWSEPLDRLLQGTTPSAWSDVKEAGLTDEEASNLLVRWAPLTHPAMPIQDAIDLVEYLADVAAGFIRFSQGPDVVAPPIDLAAITKHEKFKWVRRKHYYPIELNPT